jgi:hypothetical protein
MGHLKKSRTLGNDCVLRGRLRARSNTPLAAFANIDFEDLDHRSSNCSVAGALGVSFVTSYSVVVVTSVSFVSGNEA